MRIELCGEVAIVGPDGPEVVSRPQVQLCLAVLVLERPRPVSRHELAHLLWGDDLSDHWQGALRGVLTKLRSGFEASGAAREVLATSRGVVSLTLPAGAQVDVDVARVEVQRAEVALRDGLRGSAAEHAATAVDVVSRGFLPGLDAEWADERRRELEDLHRRAGRLLARAHVEAGTPAEALEPLRRLLATDPYDEDTLVLLLRAQGGTGDLHGARRAYDDHADLLRRELGVGPSPRLTAVRDELLDGRAAARLGTSGAPRPARTATRPARQLSGPFVGRDGPFEELMAVVCRSAPHAPSGARMVVVEGEPGVGKTRLVAEVARRAHRDGARVLWGGCAPHPELPYEPIATALAGALADDAEVRADLADLQTALAPLGVGPSPRRGADLERTGSSGRRSLFRATTAAVERLADRPLLWVVDDLQWARPDSLALLRSVLDALRERTVTVVATCRDRPPDLAASLAELAWMVPTTTLDLEGLDDAAVRRWLDDQGIADAAAVAEPLRRRTGGNALFIDELVRVASAAGGRLDPDAVPAGLVELLGQRVATLAPDADLVLSVAAVAGRSVSYALLAEATGLDEPALFEAVDAVVRARLLEERGEGVRFRHALVRDGVAGTLKPARTTWFHLRLAEALEPWSHRPGVPAELARHFAAAGEGHGDQARRWALSAAEDALDRGGWEMAEEFARTVSTARTAAPEDRVGALVVMGRARRGLGDLEGAEAVLAEAVELARLHELPRRLAEAVRAVVGGGGIGAPDSERYRHVELVEAAIAGLGVDDDDLRIPLLGSLALALLLTDRDDERERAALEALNIARRHGDPAVMARALLDQRYRVAQDRVEERLREGEEALALATRCHLPEVTAAALVYRHEDALVLGDRTVAREALDGAAQHLERVPDPYWGWALATWRVLESVLDGDLDAAEAGSAAALAGVSDDGAPSWAMACFGVHLVLLRTHQGRTAEVVPMLARAAADNPRVPCYRAVLAFAALEAGDHDLAAAELERFAGDGFASVPHDSNRLLSLAMLAETAVGLGVRPAGQRLAEALIPYRDLYVVLNCYGGGGSVWGPVSAQLAGLAALVGDHDTAAAWHGEADAMCARMGDVPFAARLAARGSRRR